MATLSSGLSCKNQGLPSCWHVLKAKGSQRGVEVQRVRLESLDQLSSKLTVMQILRKWQPTPACWPGELHGQRSLVGFSPRGCKEAGMTEQRTLSHSLALEPNSTFQPTTFHFPDQAHVSPGEQEENPGPGEALPWFCVSKEKDIHWHKALSKNPLITK